MVTKQTFWNLLLHLFSFKFRRFLSTVGLSNEDNCCQLQGIGKLIKEKPSQGIFKLINLLMALEIQISSSLLLTSANKQRTFFTGRVLFGIIFFLKIVVESCGCGLYTTAAYTRVLSVFYPELTSMEIINATARHFFYIWGWPVDSFVC